MNDESEKIDIENELFLDEMKSRKEYDLELYEFCPICGLHTEQDTRSLNCQS